MRPRAGETPPRPPHRHEPAPGRRSARVQRRSFSSGPVVAGPDATRAGPGRSTRRWRPPAPVDPRRSSIVADRYTADRRADAGTSRAHRSPAGRASSAASRGRGSDPSRRAAKFSNADRRAAPPPRQHQPPSVTRQRAETSASSPRSARSDPPRRTARTRPPAPSRATFAAAPAARAGYRVSRRRSVRAPAHPT